MDWGSCLGGPEGDVATISCLEPLFANVVNTVLALSGIALFIMLIIGGYNFLFAGGDMKKIEKAKGAMSGAIIGIVVMVVAFLIIRLITEFTGVSSILEFRINTNQ